MNIFNRAVPVWEVNKEAEKNYFLVFRAVLPGAGSAMLRLTGSTSYNLFVNGRFAATGPARSPHGFFRVDELDLAGLLDSGDNLVAIVAAGYAVNGYGITDQPSFLQAEVLRGGEIAAATGANGFSAFHMYHKTQKTQRFSFQRPFCEEYIIDRNYGPMLADPAWRGEPVLLAAQPEVTLLPRDTPYSDYPLITPSRVVSRGVFERVQPEPYRFYKHVASVGEKIKGFRLDELENCITDDVRSMSFSVDPTDQPVSDGLTVTGGACATLKFDRNATGILSFKVEARSDTALYILYDEILTDGDIDFLRLNCTRAVKYRLPAGTHILTPYEIVTLQYVKFCADGGPITVSDVRLSQVVYPRVRHTLKHADKALVKVYDAAVETFRQNAVDILMDCPSRERAGWLCDSYFTGRAEHAITGKCDVEKAFLLNFLLPESFDNHPDGMVPMCWPSDHYDGRYIPNWAMWLVLELLDYRKRTGDAAFVERFKPLLYRLVRYFETLENEDGMLEKLGTWVFIDSSESNKLAQDVNYPSNMLYGAMLRAMDALYGDAALGEKAVGVLKTAAEKSYDSESGFFCDNAVRRDGRLVNTGIATEACQYYAFYLGAATPESHPELWNRLLTDFGPGRADSNKYPDVAFANAFIAIFVRLDMLFERGLHARVLEEIKGYFLYMAEATGTLWERVDEKSSMCHGFASHAVYWVDAILRDKADRS